MLRPVARVSLVVAAASFALVSGCASHGSAPMSRVVPAASAQQRTASFGQVAKLAGEWRLTDDQGNVMQGDEAATTRFDVSSAGTIVRETMFVGLPHEMTNVYHFDGEELVVTHYCAMGNQPRMRATEVSPGRIAFKLDNVTNLTGKDPMCMGGLVLEMPDADHVRQTWTTFQGDKTLPHTVITLVRAK